eukprot:TRINITY_DN52_c0_g1_i15.p1 TRINITY_DN52_c0_g1~~TRINITY_DN52_c0_g1_i15.p1  ORF type:complete len:321 (-),score=71.82 TRINITY_DN52_c0_g1_i15:195-1157(-)
MSETYIEKYYDQIKDFTFRSTFRLLSRETAGALCSEHAKYKADKTATWGGNQLLCALATSIDQAKAELAVPWVFIRLSSRSPKDAPMTLPSFRSVYDKEFQWVLNDEHGLPPYSGQELNRKLCAIYRATTFSMRVATGADAVNLLVRSDRIQGDLENFHRGQITEQFSVVIREFRTFDPDLEFRGFVYKGKFTALTQYNDYTYFPKLVARKQQILELIQREYALRVLPNVKLSSYVIDFVLCVPSEQGYAGRADRFDNLGLWVVEVNPLAEFAGTGMFTWEKDRDVLLGKQPFEFRMQGSCWKEAYANLAEDVKEFLKST